jgi:hypothetical protein
MPLCALSGHRIVSVTLAMEAVGTEFWPQQLYRHCNCCRGHSRPQAVPHAFHQQQGRGEPRMREMSRSGGNGGGEYVKAIRGSALGLGGVEEVGMS